MLPSSGSLFLLQSYTFRLCIRRFVSGLICLVFVMVITHLIVMEPVFRNHRARFHLRKYNHTQKRSFSELHFDSELYNQSSKHCNNFVVFDAKSYSGNLTFLNSQPTGWCTVVVNLNDSMKLSTCANCMVVKDEWVVSRVTDLIAKKFDTSGHLSLSHSQLSKMAAYLFVLLQKPNWIFVTDRTSPIPHNSFAKVTGAQVKTGPVYQGPKEIFEPCRHYIDPVTWREHDNNQGQERYNVKVVSSHSVYHVMDSCYRPGMDPDVLKESFDNEAPIPYIMPGTYGAMDFNNVLVSGDNAWTLVASLAHTPNGLDLSDKGDKLRNSPNISTSNSSSESNIGDFKSSVSTNLTLSTQINLLVQRLLWESEVTIGFLPGSRNYTSGAMSCHSCDVFSQLSATDRKYFDALLDWKCDSFQDIRNCFVNLSSDKTLSNGDLEYLVHIWVFILTEYKIENVVRVAFSKERLHDRLEGIPLYFSPTGLVKNDTIRPNPFQNMCKIHGRPYHSVIPDKYPVSDILLIIVFNFPHLVSHIPLLDYVYGRHFKHILYCSENIADFDKLYQETHRDKPVSWIEIKHYMGYWGQNCMSAAIKTGYSVRGYLQISDDVIMNIWNFDKLPYNKPWFQSNMRVAHIDRQIVPDVWINQYWWPWSQFSGKQSALATFNHMETMLSNPSDGDRISAFMENIYNITNCERCFLYEASDIFYLPSELGANFTFFSDIFSYNKVFLEITIPTVLVGITSDRDVYRLRGNYLWFHDRERYPFVYTQFDHFYHAWKFTRFGDGREAQFFCRQFLSRVDKHLMRKSAVGSA